MLRVSAYEITEGMVLARALPHPDKPEHTLLKAGFELDTETVGRLQSLKVPGAWVKYPDLDFLDEKLDPELIRSQQELYGTLKKGFTEGQESSLAKLTYSEYTDKISALFQRMLHGQSASSGFLSDLHVSSPDIFLHGTVVASLAMLVGLRLEAHIVRERPNAPAAHAMDLTQLGVGCLLHDIGKLLLPEELHNFHLTAQNLGTPEWQAHTEIGLEMIHGGLDPAAGQVVLNHHQHYDGSGFPQRKGRSGQPGAKETLSSGDIHIFCRIATVLDRFCGFRYLPDGRQAPAVVALKRMQNPGYVRWFDPIVYEAFIKTVMPFCPGEQVILSSGETAVVVETDEQHPCQPTVRTIDPALAVQPDAKGNTESQAAETKAEPTAEKNGDKETQATSPETESSNEDAATETKGEDKPPETTDINLADRPDLHIKAVGDIDVTRYLY